MEGFRELSDGEIVSLYEQAALHVGTWKDQTEGDVRLCAFKDVNHGAQALTCEVLGIVGCDLTAIHEKLRIRFPNARFYVEPVTGGMPKYILSFPIFVPDTTRSMVLPSGRPSNEKLMMLFMVDVVLAVSLWYRVTFGFAL